MSVIADVMSEQDIAPAEIPFEQQFNPHHRWSILKNSERYFRVKGKGWYHCSCDGERYSWSSPHSWAIIDLKAQKIRYSWHEQCRYCRKKKLPKFPLDSIRSMAIAAVRKYLVRIGEIDPGTSTCYTDEEEDSEVPHLQHFCGMCKELQRPCWLRHRPQHTHQLL